MTNELVKIYFNLGLSNREILEYLAQYGCIISIRTLKGNNQKSRSLLKKTPQRLIGRGLLHRGPN